MREWRRRQAAWATHERKRALAAPESMAAPRGGLLMNEIERARPQANTTYSVVVQDSVWAHTAVTSNHDSSF